MGAASAMSCPPLVTSPLTDTPAKVQLHDVRKEVQQSSGVKVTSAPEKDRREGGQRGLTDDSREACEE
ncbi:hypothetical protein H920_15590 [Fukomys damarensis]|uniref:Uncharacterized protein n=1 Tax=Fukomys damarensis TaxID=885580 RepID=A0A091CWI2_FUKDA|nr:hypothetical protein H920_15590 [Fukomys damarensis]